MAKTLAIIHTTPVTVTSLKELAARYLPDYKLIHFIDESILPQLRENGGKIEEVEERLVQYAAFAEQSGADVILNACSSVGEVAEKMKERVQVPVVRIDEAMAEEAIRRGKRIAVVATLSTTLVPTRKLLETKAAEHRKQIHLHPVLVEEAFRRLQAGDADGHDQLLVEKLSELSKEMDVVVLAQASMARAAAQLPAPEQEKCLTSPELGMKLVADVMQGSAGQ
ncbi:aspartate/glutamate racemase family protein [Lihuaxuella thermophila]|uniref:Asp/Glu/Hydantoin racemase n=1 Tax=Lihuaxuella thermophila TaxID=1173111 RepID=A0A1H8GA77_9BACL|nr:aspartate/glutamate racemase family protein [Lihuaxuella thermophila]SEN40427.1 Asp/Glu/Hydantoin racemase [Lihuaxuella thermophila]